MSARSGATTTLALLAAFSGLSFALAERFAPGLAIGLAAAGIALAKVGLIVARFMHLGRRHRPFAQVMAGWVLLVALILGVGLAALPWPVPSPTEHQAKIG